MLIEADFKEEDYDAKSNQAMKEAIATLALISDSKREKSIKLMKNNNQNETADPDREPLNQALDHSKINIAD